MSLQELKKILYKAILYREDGKIVCATEQDAKDVMLAIQKLLKGEITLN